ncbi:MAG TPA: response regulator [Geobacterales bacterium]|nr:response regulator [Geobacterales bacterium]
MPLPKILLVDDVRLFVEIERGFLQQSPVEILTAANGAEALAMIRAHHPQLVVMDINMPQMDGLQCCAAVKADPAIQSIPVILLTNADRKQDHDACIKVGCDALLSKPIDGKLFRERLHAFLPTIDRRGPRISCSMPVQIDHAEGIVPGVLLELSMGGAYVASNVNVSRNEEALLTFRVPAATVNTTVSGRVAWLNRGAGRQKGKLPEGFGVEFVEVTGEGMPLVRSNELKGFVMHQAELLKKG